MVVSLREKFPTPSIQKHSQVPCPPPPRILSLSVRLSRRRVRKKGYVNSHYYNGWGAAYFYLAVPNFRFPSVSTRLIICSRATQCPRKRQLKFYFIFFREQISGQVLYRWQQSCCANCDFRPEDETVLQLRLSSSHACYIAISGDKFPPTFSIFGRIFDFVPYDA